MRKKYSASIHKIKLCILILSELLPLHTGSNMADKMDNNTDDVNNSGKCVFCDIVEGKIDNDKVIYEDENLVVFPDRRPASMHHYLVVTKEHIRDAKHLNGSHIQTVEKMVNTGKQVLQNNGGNVDDIRMGFHWPPFHSVSHLHLHVISPQSQMSFLPRGIFKVNSPWFVTPVWVLARLKRATEGQN